MDLEATQTNIVIADFADTRKEAGAIAQKLAEQGLLSIAFSKSKIRFVTHLDVSDDDIEYAVDVIKKVLRSLN